MTRKTNWKMSVSCDGSKLCERKKQAGDESKLNKRSRSKRSILSSKSNHSNKSKLKEKVISSGCSSGWSVSTSLICVGPGSVVEGPAPRPTSAYTDSLALPHTLRPGYKTECSRGTRG